MLDSLNSRVEEVYRSCIGDNEANIRLVYFLLSWQPSVQVFDWWVVLVPVCWLSVQSCTCMTNTIIMKKIHEAIHLISTSHSKNNKLLQKVHFGAFSKIAIFALFARKNHSFYFS